jgi:hypothetical protein
MFRRRAKPYLNGTALDVKARIVSLRCRFCSWDGPLHIQLMGSKRSPFLQKLLCINCNQRLKKNVALHAASASAHHTGVGSPSHGNDKRVLKQ